MKTNFIIAMVFILSNNLIYSQSNVDYKYVTTSTGGIEYFVYLEQVSTNGKKDVWLKSITPLKNPKGKKIKGGGQATLMLLNMDCSKREYDTLETILYDKSGKVITSSKNVSFGNRIVPGSVMTGIYDYVCGN